MRNSLNPGARFLFWGALNAGLAVMLGAFGKHALKSMLSEPMMETWRTAAYYHLTHALALVLVAVIVERSSRPDRVAVAGWLLLTGMLLFSGSLYLLALTGFRPLGIVTPLGGGCFLFGWFWLARSAMPNTAS
ncbi:MAG: DUF423 domain-containing protein [Magnetococcales bacterium]|nr:DUF423 domain-containing protein [Magnetococcales bacterium]